MAKYYTQSKRASRYYWKSDAEYTFILEKEINVLKRILFHTFSIFISAIFIIILVNQITHDLNTNSINQTVPSYNNIKMEAKFNSSDKTSYPESKGFLPDFIPMIFQMPKEVTTCIIMYLLLMWPCWIIFSKSAHSLIDQVYLYFDK